MPLRGRGLGHELLPWIKELAILAKASHVCLRCIAPRVSLYEEADYRQCTYEYYESLLIPSIIGDDDADHGLLTMTDSVHIGPVAVNPSAAAVSDLESEPDDDDLLVAVWKEADMEGILSDVSNEFQPMLDKLVRNPPSFTDEARMPPTVGPIHNQQLCHPLHCYLLS